MPPELNETYDRYIEVGVNERTGGETITFRYAKNLAYKIETGSTLATDQIELALRLLTKAAYDAGRRKGRVETAKLFGLGMGPYR